MPVIGEINIKGQEFQENDKGKIKSVPVLKIGGVGGEGRVTYLTSAYL